MMSANALPGRHRRKLARTGQKVVEDFRNQLPSRMRVSKSKQFTSSTTSQPDYIQVLRFRDGKHVSFHIMFDQLMMLEQLALVPTSAAVA
jgi:hypothetical protein